MKATIIQILSHKIPRMTLSWGSMWLCGIDLAESMLFGTLLGIMM